MRAALFFLLIGALLCGCGQKGPLFIPNDDASADSSAPQATPDTQSDADTQSNPGIQAQP